MKQVFGYIRDTSFADIVSDVEYYAKLCKQVRALERKEIKASLNLMESYNYFEEDKYPTCISYVKANTVNGAIRGGHVCKRFNKDMPCENMDCPSQAAHAAYVAAHKGAEIAAALRDSFWDLMIDGRVK